MPRFIVLLFVLACAFSQKGMAQANRVASINLCTDQLLLMLADKEQIASITQLSREPKSSFMAEQAKEYAVNHAKVEELLILKPDLILTSEYSDRQLVAMLKSFGLRVEIIPSSSNLDDIRSNIRKVAQLIDQQDRGEQLIQQMDERLEQIVTAQSGARPKAMFYQPNGYTSGRNTLQDTALTLAGWRNISAELGYEGYGSIDLEALLLAEPEQLFTSVYAPGTQSLAQGQLSHPALKKLLKGKKLIDIDYKYWICGGPMIVDAIEILNKSLPLQ